MSADTIPEHTTAFDRYLRHKEVQRISGLSLSTLLRLEARNSFPRRRRISENRVAWLESEIREWLHSRKPCH